MSMAAIPFDALGYFEALKNVGFTEAQAKVQANTLQTALNRYDETSRKDLATRGDVQDVRSELKEDIQNVRAELKEDIQDVRTEIQDVRTELKEDIQDVRLEVEKVRAQSREAELRLQKEIRETELRLQKEIQGTETRLIKWQLGIAAGIVSVMLTGFGAMATIMAKSPGWSGF